ncbi:MAG: F0F1 ATP synthase subunit epsilon [Cypionkella sp.]|jgi:F-type H+-transporting ATPase subunit epsilon
MRLRIVTPLAVIAEEDFTSLRAEDASGGFGIMQGHAAFLTALTISIISWRQGAAETFCALRGGTLVVTDGNTVTITTREAVLGEDLATLDAEVLARFRTEVETERAEHVETMQLQLNAIRRMVSRLQRNSASIGAFG